MTMSCLFIEKKQPSSLTSLETVGEEDAVFVNERHDKLVLEDKKLTHAIFFNLGLKDAHLIKSDFSFSTFFQCYFKGATIAECRFTGCRFIDCNFRMADISNCDFTYTDWRNTTVTLSQVRTSIPERQNVAHSLLEALRNNCLSRGDSVEARRFLFESMRASREHLRRKAFSKDRYYANHYTRWQRIEGSFQYMGSQIERGWGYGERPWLLMLWISLCLLLFSLYYLYAIPAYFNFTAGQIIPTLGSFYKAFKFSVLALTSNVPPVFTQTDFNSISGAFGFESFLGLLFIGLIAATFYRKISIRQG